MRITWKAVTVISCAIAAPALAVPAHPGDVVNVNGVTSATEPWQSGVIEDGANLSVFTVRDEANNPVFTGEFTSEPSRSHDLGTIRVRYRVRNIQGVVGNRRVVRVELFGFAGLQTNVDYRTDGVGDIGPNLVSRTNGDGNQVSFLFANPQFTNDLDSYFFHIHTNATTFHEQGFARVVLNTGESAVIAFVHLPSFSDCPGDTNNDGIINFTDLNTVLSAYGDICD